MRGGDLELLNACALVAADSGKAGIKAVASIWSGLTSFLC
jgi:hypothetical protein